MNNVQRESFTGMIQLLEQALNNEKRCIETGEFDRFLEALADWNASKFYALESDEIPWMERATELTVSQMTSIILSYGFNVYEMDTSGLSGFLTSARDHFISEYRKAVYRFQSE